MYKDYIKVKVKVKVKFTLERHAPAALPPGKTRYPLYRRLGRPQGRSGRMRIQSPPRGFDPRIVQPVAVAVPTELSRPVIY
jgi:hypothetical protein